MNWDYLLKSSNLTNKLSCARIFFFKSKYTEDDLEKLDELNKAIQRALYKISKNEILELIYLSFSDLSNLEFSSETKKLLGKKQENIQKKICITNSSQFLTAMTIEPTDEEE